MCTYGQRAVEVKYPVTTMFKQIGSEHRLIDIVGNSEVSL